MVGKLKLLRPDQVVIRGVLMTVKPTNRWLDLCAKISAEKKQQKKITTEIKIVVEPPTPSIPIVHNNAHEMAT